MSYSPKVSIVIPIYNAASFLCKCIDSILKQAFTDYELILVDDGSTDKSGEICDDYAKNNNKIRSIHKKNGGVSSARNLGIENAFGEWICFVDADDLVSPDWLSGFFNSDSNADLITHPVLLVYPNGESQMISYSSDGKSVEQIIWDLYENHLLGFVWSMFYRRKTIQNNKLKFNERLQSGEDLEFMSRFSTCISKIDNFFVGYYKYTFPKYKKTYGKVRNVYFLIYFNLQDFFKSKLIKKKFIKLIAPHLLQYILKAYTWSDKETARICINFYKNKVPVPFFLTSCGKLMWISNILVKLDAEFILELVAKVMVSNRYDRGFEYIDF